MTPEYVIWSTKHRAWWGPDEQGYRVRLSSAGRYSRNHALAICTWARGGRQHNDSPTEVPLLLADAGIFWPDQTEEPK
ncbi:MAG TPA: hypothetical protein GXX24_00795 [Paracoccus solventivorans]|uniref:Uncharacterized protein n=1 Tax=Paracoccus solventivorans TaxID=53463 RepID=A0A832QWJ8_9RHOB|nr:hypothetical protein [Paracoccus solventivorans]HHW32670.1 hypothetical protein [Paracoccus solventivorans]